MMGILQILPRTCPWWHLCDVPLGDPSSVWLQCLSESWPRLPCEGQCGCNFYTFQVIFQEVWVEVWRCSRAAVLQHSQQHIEEVILAFLLFCKVPDNRCLEVEWNWSNTKQCHTLKSDGHTKEIMRF
jgi:hypothetical protein